MIKREDTLESGDEVTIQVALEELREGDHIRRKGENIRAGETVLPAGTVINAAAASAVASFGSSNIAIRERLKVSILNTGDELAPAGSKVKDWQIRDSNGPTLRAWLSRFPWIEVIACEHVGDTLAQVQASVSSHLERSDAVVLTGGVSMGDTDYVPQAVESIGGQIHFHRLPIRPGRPVLGATREGKLILGLPGNPVSVAVTSRVIGLPLLRHQAGITPSLSTPVGVMIEKPDDRRLHLVWYRLVQQMEDGNLKFATSKGSGDLVSLAQSAGFVQIPPGASGSGPWPFYAWE